MHVGIVMRQRRHQALRCDGARIDKQIRNCQGHDHRNKCSGRGRTPEGEAVPETNPLSCRRAAREELAVKRALEIGRRFDRFKGLRHAGQANLPGIDFAGECGIGIDARGSLTPLGIRQDAENIFGGEHVLASVLFHVPVVGWRHRSRHSLSFSRLRRSQVRIVLSGTA